MTIAGLCQRHVVAENAEDAERAVAEELVRAARVVAKPALREVQSAYDSKRTLGSKAGFVPRLDGLPPRNERRYKSRVELLRDAEEEEEALLMRRLEDAVAAAGPMRQETIAVLTYAIESARKHELWSQLSRTNHSI